MVDLWGKVHTLNEQLATSGREGLVFTARHKKPCSDDLVVTAFHPTTGGSRSFLMLRPEAEELHAALGKWLSEGWAGFVDGAPGPGGGYRETSKPATTDARSWIDAYEERRRLSEEGQKRIEEKHAGTYASWTHDELVAELRLMKYAVDDAKRGEQNWRAAMERDRAGFRATIGRLRDVLKGRKTASVDELSAALKDPTDEEI
ncbi:hypothetical protein ACIQUY_04815 [Streptomyces sp. NPDC090231]|uniref:hypothetical protein n=1 Tax=unclassified Streptomyces TaxID=2593676 RepID=UPI0037FDAD0C